MTSACLRLSRVSTATAIVIALAAAPAAAAGYLKLGDIKGDVDRSGRGGEIHIESFSWGATQTGSAHGAGGGGGAGKVNVHDISMAPSSGVEREMKESGEKGGTEEINIGVGELQEATISKSSDKATPKLLESAVKGKVFKSPAPRGSMTTVVPAGTCRVGARYPTAELGTGTRVYRMTGVVVTGCTAASGSDGSIPTETLSLNYDKIVWK